VIAGPEEDDLQKQIMIGKRSRNTKKECKIFKNSCAQRSKNIRKRTPYVPTKARGSVCVRGVCTNNKKHIFRAEGSTRERSKIFIRMQ
jgi:hypothetical protein